MAKIEKNRKVVIVRITNKSNQENNQMKLYKNNQIKQKQILK